MKTAVSVPDDVFRAADRLAKRQRKSRSRLYSDALALYLARHDDDAITEALDRVWSDEPPDGAADAFRPTGGLPPAGGARPVAIGRGDVWWADAIGPAPEVSSLPRPVVVVQCDSFNRSAIRTVVVVHVTSRLRLADAPGNVALPRKATGLPKDSVADVGQVHAVDRTALTARVGRLPPPLLEGILLGIERMLGR